MNRPFSIFIFAMFILSACQPQSNQAVERDPLEEAYQKIDQGRYDQAIDDLEHLAVRDFRPQVTEALASAYAARAGIMVSKYWGAVVGFKAPLIEGDIIDWLRTPSPLKEVPKKDRDIKGFGQLQRLGGLFHVFEEWNERISQLPAVSLEQQPDLLEALMILREHPTPGGRIYRALLGLILLKSRWSEGFDNWNSLEEEIQIRMKESGGNTLNARMLCFIDFDGFLSWGEESLEILQSVGQDIVVAYPSKKAEVEKALQVTGRVGSYFLAQAGASCR